MHGRRWPSCQHSKPLSIFLSPPPYITAIIELKIILVHNSEYIATSLSGHHASLWGWQQCSRVTRCIHTLMKPDGSYACTAQTHHGIWSPNIRSHGGLRRDCSEVRFRAMSVVLPNTTHKATHPQHSNTDYTEGGSEKNNQWEGHAGHGHLRKPPWPSYLTTRPEAAMAGHGGASSCSGIQVPSVLDGLSCLPTG